MKRFLIATTALLASMSMASAGLQMAPEEKAQSGAFITLYDAKCNEMPVFLSNNVVKLLNQPFDQETIRASLDEAITAYLSLGHDRFCTIVRASLVDNFGEFEEGEPR